MTNKQEERLIKAAEYCHTITTLKPTLGITLGSGLGEYAHAMDVAAEIPYSDIPDFPVSTVEGHDGKFLFGYIEDVPCVLMKGRIHYYEGYPMNEVVMPIQLMALLGIGNLLLTNAVGGIREDLRPGDFMLLTGQIASFVPSPLRGPNISILGPRFPDMSDVYDKHLSNLMRAAALDEEIPIKEGVYVQSAGPNYESTAEVVMFKAAGADAVGMSVAAEAIAARHAGVAVCGMSFISNLAAGVPGAGELNHEEVQAMATRRAPDFERLVSRFVSKLSIVR